MFTAVCILIFDNVITQKAVPLQFLQHLCRIPLELMVIKSRGLEVFKYNVFLIYELFVYHLRHISGFENLNS